MMTDERVVVKGTPIRCNRCGAKGTFNKAEGRAVRENSKAWRMQTFSIPECGHMDAHWVFDCDEEVK